MDSGKELKYRRGEKDLRGVKVLVVGLGRSGAAASKVLCDLGASVTVQDAKREDEFDPNYLTFIKESGIKCVLGEKPADVKSFDMIVLSPGVSPEVDFVAEAAENGAEVIGELELAYRLCEGKFVAITGTNGKTTTTTLTGEIFKAAGRKTHVVGNIGTAVISEVEGSCRDDWYVTEASSFQLETTKYFHPVVSAILNITPDHLNRHHTMEAYAAAKGRIFANQTESDFLVVNKDSKEAFELSSRAECKVVPFSRKETLGSGACLEGGRIIIRDKGQTYDICGTDELKIIGDHNVENVLAAAAVSYFSGIDPKTIGDAVRSFGGVAHRIEYCGMIDGVKYYNDSKGTNIDAAVTALRAIKKDIILIAGGDAKGQVFDDFIDQFDGSVKRMIIFGRDGHLIAEAADRNGFSAYEYCKDLDECVKRAAEIAEPGDTVLLSPACASWDMYDNYEQRGDHFKSIVKSMNV
ncbi:MAG: UDP-N-acetylmuramoyl-L-alanine--D-glutamate ligase [Eubacterium sp.]|jgi:UDP-N-acetylmuramoylalanine--D-glutamate ligase